MATFNLFNETVYLDLNPDVRAAVQQGLIEARSHFEQWGRDEGRMASYLFNPADYLAIYQDAAQAVAEGWMNVYQHFEAHGAAEGRTPFAGFDLDHYLSENPDVAAKVDAGVGSAVLHFLQYGQYEIRNFNPGFDVEAFLDANPDAADAIQAGLMSVGELVVQHFTVTDGGAGAWGGLDGDGLNGGDSEDPGADFDADIDAIVAQLTAILATMGAAIDIEALQQRVLESGLLDPANLNPDGSGLTDPMPLVELVWDHFYGVNPIDIIGTLPDLPGAG